MTDLLFYLGANNWLKLNPWFYIASWANRGCHPLEIIKDSEDSLGWHIPLLIIAIETKHSS